LNTCKDIHQTAEVWHPAPLVLAGLQSFRVHDLPKHALQAIAVTGRVHIPMNALNPQAQDPVAEMRQRRLRVYAHLWNLVKNPEVRILMPAQKLLGVPACHQVRWPSGMHRCQIKGHGAWHLDCHM